MHYLTHTHTHTCARTSTPTCVRANIKQQLKKQLKAMHNVIYTAPFANGLKYCWQLKAVTQGVRLAGKTEEHFYGAFFF